MTSNPTGARDGWRVASIRLPADRTLRTPRVVVVLARDGLGVAVAVRRLRTARKHLDVMLPLAADASPGVILPPDDVRALAEAACAAVRDDPEAWAHLMPRW